MQSPARLFESMVAATLILSAGCAPTFSEMQSARLVGRGGTESTFSYSTVNLAGRGSRAKVQDNFGIQVATGLSATTDLRFRFERVVFHLGNETSGINHVALGLKIAAVPERVSVYFPVGVAFSSSTIFTDQIQIHPTLLGTIPLGRHVDVTASSKLLLPLSGQGDPAVALNLGIGIGSDRTRELSAIIHPEVGILFGPGDDERQIHVGVGLTSVKRKAK